MNKNVELRKLPAGSLCNIVNILETNNDWKKVMSFIPKNPQSASFEPKYSNEHIRLIEEYAKVSSRKCSEILFDEWGTSGAVRPTLDTLKNVVLQAEIYRAADEIALMLKENLPPRPEGGPAANIPITDYLNDSLYQTHLNMHSKSQDHGIGNRTTVQMKSASDLIQFSKSTDIPNISALQSMYNRTTAAMVSDPSVIKELNQQQYNNETEESRNIPKLSELITNSNYDPYSNPTSSDIESDNGFPQFEYSVQNVDTDNYQKSLPNIDISNGIDTTILQNTSLIHFEYKVLESITNRFNDTLVNGPAGPTGKIGSGGFGEVYVGVHERHGRLAVKKIHSHHIVNRKNEIEVKMFNAEVKCLSQLRHENIVPILGFSKDGPALCIVFEYIDGGSLEQKLAAKVLNEKQRLNIMIGTAEGLKYIHRCEKPMQTDDMLYKLTESESGLNYSRTTNFLHGDVKSANILLTGDCNPKLCDFGLAKQYDATFVTSCLMGTSAYMAPEGFSGTITQKNDIYSFGIVLLELLTGLKPIVMMNNETINIKNYIEENCNNNEITNLLDPVVGNWTKAEEIYSLANKCLVYQRTRRPSIEEICDALHTIID